MSDGFEEAVTDGFEEAVTDGFDEARSDSGILYSIDVRSESIFN